jgi:hypothetical protein
MSNNFEQFNCINHPGSMGCLDCKCKNCLSFFSYIDNPSYKKKRVEKKRKIKNKK